MIALTAGPWSGRYHNGPSWTLTLEEVRAVLIAVPDKPAMCAALGVDQFSNPKADRALQILRKARLIEYRGSWSRTPAGDAEVKRLKEVSP